MPRALIVEDDANNMELIAFILEKHGYGTARAWTGRDGIAGSKSPDLDLVILDIQLPDIDGEAVLRAIRAHPATAALPVIAVTSYAMTGDRERLMAAGCDGYIEKPIEPERVMEQINGILEGSRP